VWFFPKFLVKVGNGLIEKGKGEDAFFSGKKKKGFFKKYFVKMFKQTENICLPDQSIIEF